MLELCATPIGNLGDITLRALEALRGCDAVYCEDTRRTALLLAHYGIQKPLFSCHEHNERTRAAEIVERLQRGERIVYASDAGMPGISDPGAALVRACIEHDLPCTVLPGASAVPAAALLSGLPMSPFSFFGFLPRENKPRREMLERIAACDHLAILFESPNRLRATLEALLSLLGDRPAAVLRELTKLHEECARGTLSELAARYAEPPRGECVVAVYCRREAPAADDQALDALLLDAFARGLSLRDAVAEAAAAASLPKKRVYSRARAITKVED
ncbi:MAG: 16S rRNA (cytidine(1402)-2'-O)-methyltransferase [Clostridia bacterium]|nr:16S rRNA (cytidine(1402)-2'-O)-methyltransferase [Clostridia bacterium]